MLVATLTGCTQLDPYSSPFMAKLWAAVHSDPIVATIGNYPVSKAQTAVHYQVVKNLGTDPRLQSDFGRHQWLDGYLNQRALALLAIQNGMEDSAAYKNKFESMKEQALAVALYDSVVAHVSVTDDEIKQYYADHYKPSTILKIRRIETRTANNAQKIHEFLLHPNQFTISRITTLINKDQLVTTISDPISSEKIGQIMKLDKNRVSPVIKVNQSYLIFQKMEEEVAPPPSFDVVKNDVRKKVISQKASVFIENQLLNMPIKIDTKVANDLLGS